MSLIDKILKPLACKALKAVSLPDPGPLTSTDKVFIPYSRAFEAAESAAICAAFPVAIRTALLVALPSHAICAAFYAACPEHFLQHCLYRQFVQHFLQHVL